MGLLVAALALSAGATATAGAQAASAAPVNISPPLVKGKASDGRKLKATSGKWSGGKPTFSYRWERCDEAGEQCASVSGTSSSYLAGDADVGHRLRAIVTATNGEGTDSATTAASAKIAAVGPKKKGSPAIT